MSGKYVHPKEFAPWIKWKVDFSSAEKAQEETIMRGLSDLVKDKEGDQAGG